MAVELDEQLLQILACPSEDHAPLRLGTPDDPAADALTCTACGRQFPVRDGIPVLLLDEATEPEAQSNDKDAGSVPTHRPEPEGAGNGV